jgi:hypothetical protein
VSIDGYHGTSLERLREKVTTPAGYRPIGFRVYAGEPTEKNFLSVSLFAVDCDAAGVGGDALVAYVATHDEIPVFEFDVEITVQELLELVKRLDIVAFSKALQEKPVKILDDG